MITEGLLNVLFLLLQGLLVLLPDVSWNVDSNAFDTFLDIMRFGGYFLPMGTISTIIGIIFVLTLFRIFVSYIKTIWDLIPLL